MNVFYVHSPLYVYLCSRQFAFLCFLTPEKVKIFTPSVLFQNFVNRVIEHRGVFLVEADQHQLMEEPCFATLSTLTVIGADTKHFFKERIQNFEMHPPSCILGKFHPTI